MRTDLGGTPGVQDEVLSRPALLALVRKIPFANDALKRQSDQLREQATLLDLVRDGILARDLHGTIIYWSEGAAEMYGFTKAEVRGAISHQLLRAEYPGSRWEIRGVMPGAVTTLHVGEVVA